MRLTLQRCGIVSPKDNTMRKSDQQTADLPRIPSRLPNNGAELLTVTSESLAELPLVQGKHKQYKRQATETFTQELLTHHRQAVELFTEMSNIAKLSAWEIDVATWHVRWTAELPKLLGVDPNRRLDLASVLTFCLPQSQSVAQAAITNALHNGTPFDIEVTLQTVQGKLLWAQVKGRVVREQGKIVKLVGIVQDITERKVMQQALQESEARLHSLADRAPVMPARDEANHPWGEFASQTPDRLATATASTEQQAQAALQGREQMLRKLGDHLPGGFLTQMVVGPGDAHQYTYLSAGVEACTGVSVEEALQDATLLLGQIVPEDRQILRKLTIDMGQTLQPINLEVRKRLATGETRWVQIRAAPNERKANGTVVWDGLELDITNRKQAEQALQLHTQALEAISQGIAVLDCSKLDQPIVYVNASFGRLTGYTREEILGRDCGLLYGLETDPDAVERIHQTIGTQHSCLVELQIYHQAGHAFWSTLSVAPVRNEQNLVTHAVLVLTEITELKQLESELRQAQKMEAIGRLAGGLAHDFNNFLTVINGYSELMLRYLRESDPLRNKVEQIRSAGERAADLTRQLLTFSRKQVIKPEELTLNAVINNMSGLFKGLLGDDVALRMRQTSDLRPVKADRGQLEQVLINLVVNARDAMPRGGTLTITTHNLDLHAGFSQHYPKLKPGPYVILRVIDTGYGIDDSIKAHLFEPFFTTKEPGKGTGLGLATVYAIVKQSGGAISVLSEPGKGATFQLILPAVSAQLDPNTPIRYANGEQRGGNETILLVEDDEQIRTLVTTTLQSLGYTVIDAANSLGALVLFKEHQRKIDLLLTDIVMPEMNGLQLSEHLQQQQPDLRVLFVSGYTDDEMFARGLTSSAIPFLPKPYTLAHLAHKVRSVLDSGIETVMQ